MCEPVTAALVGSAATGTTGLIGTAGALGGGTIGLGTLVSGATAVMGAFNSFQMQGAYDNQARYQQQVAKQRADDARVRAQIEEDTHRRKVQSFLGTQNAQLAASGVDLGSGSASDLVADTAMVGEIDALTIRQNAEREAFLYESEGKLRSMQSRAKGKAARNEGYGSLLGGVGEVAGKWYDSKSALVS